MLRRSPRGRALAAAAVALALLTAVALVGALRGVRARAAALGPRVPLVVARHDLAIGHTVVAADVATRATTGLDSRDALTDPRDAIGRVVATPVLRGSPVSARHLAARDRDGVDGVVPRGRRAMRVLVDGGVRPEPGQAVDVYVTLDPATTGAAEPTLLVARAVPVVAVDRAGAGRVGVTLVVREAEAARLAYSAATGALALAVVPPEERTGR